MAAIKETYLNLLDGLTAAGKHARSLPTRPPTDEQLLTLARQIADRMGAARLLDAADRPTLTGLRDAYNEGRRPDRLDVEQVVAALGRRSVSTFLLETSGGTWTLYAGEPDRRHELDDPRRHPVSFGPLDWSPTEVTARAEETTYGPTGPDEYGDYVQLGDMPEDVAEAIAAQVRKAQNG